MTVAPTPQPALVMPEPAMQSGPIYPAPTGQSPLLADEPLPTPAVYAPRGPSHSPLPMCGSLEQRDSELRLDHRGGSHHQIPVRLGPAKRSNLSETMSRCMTAISSSSKAGFRRLLHRRLLGGGQLPLPLIATCVFWKLCHWPRPRPTAVRVQGGSRQGRVALNRDVTPTPAA